MTQASEPSVDPDALRVDCPICKNNTLVKHCERRECNWAKCINRECGATLDFTKNIGNYRNPEPSKHVPAWLRVKRVMRKWVPRPDGEDKSPT